MVEKEKESWGDGAAYERYVGRWSRLVARDFLEWLAIPTEKRWVDVGCGTGGLVESILGQYTPLSVIGIDQSEGFIKVARQNVADSRTRFEVGNATELPLDMLSSDATVSGLVLNFVKDHEAMAREMVRVTKPGGKVAAYVWDYSGDMEVMRQFWDAAISVTPEDAKLDQGKRFPICRPEPLKELFHAVGLSKVAAQSIDIPAQFADFQDYWSPFLGKIGSAPTYLASVDLTTKEHIRQLLCSWLLPNGDGPFTLNIRAWAVQGTV